MKNIRFYTIAVLFSHLTTPRVGTEDREVLRGDLVSLFIWSQDWQMLFNLDKCAVMHFGFNNIWESMELGGKLLVTSSCPASSQKTISIH